MCQTFRCPGSAAVALSTYRGARRETRKRLCVRCYLPARAEAVADGLTVFADPLLAPEAIAKRLRDGEIERGASARAVAR